MQVVETNTLANKCKAYDLVERIHAVIPIRVRNNIDSSNSRTEWLYNIVDLKDILQSRNCYAVVDRSFFPENLEVISAYWIFIVDYKILSREGFVVHLSKDIQSVFVVELYRHLEVLKVLQSTYRNMLI